MFKRIKYILLQIYGYQKFGKRVNIWGWFTVVNAQNVHIGHDCSINHGVFLLGRDEISHWVITLPCQRIAC